MTRRQPCDSETIAKPRTISVNRTVTNARKIEPKNMEDLIHLQGPLTEDAVMRALQARFNDGKYFVSNRTNWTAIV